MWLSSLRNEFSGSCFYTMRYMTYRRYVKERVIYVKIAQTRELVNEAYLEPTERKSDI